MELQKILNLKGRKRGKKEQRRVGTNRKKYIERW